MPKTFFCLLLTLFILKASAQDSLHLFYISKIYLTKDDSAEIVQCKKADYKSVSLRLDLFSRNNPTETLYVTGNNYRWWKDSVFFSYTAPAALYKSSDSVIIHPTFHVACSGLQGNRGVENVEAEGKESTVRNITLKFVSNPPGANVYLIPKMIWERTPGLNGKSKNENLLSRYTIYSGVTPVESTAQEYVYIALFKLNNRYVSVECSPTHFKTDDSVFANFPQP